MDRPDLEAGDDADGPVSTGRSRWRLPAWAAGAARAVTGAGPDDAYVQVAHRQDGRTGTAPFHSPDPEDDTARRSSARARSPSFDPARAATGVRPPRAARFGADGFFRHPRTALAASAGVVRGVVGMVLGFALPPTCIGCGTVTGSAGGLCGTCWGRLSFITSPCCERTGAPFAFDDGAPRIHPDALDSPPAFDRARAAVTFTDAARDLVHKLKYADRLDVAAPMARLMAQAGAELIASADLIVPVPLHAVRLWRRRFNQAAMLGRHIGAASGLPQRTDLLTRRRATRTQTSLGRAERRANVAGAFAPCGNAASVLAGRRVLLVDDVYTTGATLDACALALRRAGASGVDALTFARVVDFA